MNLDMGKGLIIGIVFYLLGTILTAIVHKIAGWKNPHSPPASALIILLYLLIGFIRILINTSRILKNQNKERNKGELAVHLIAFAIVIIFLLWI